MTTPSQAAERYLAMWNEPDPARRRAMIEAGWMPGGRYADPLMASEGQAAICGMIEAARAQFPGHAFELRGVPDGHGRHVRFAWSLVPDGGSPIAGGTDVARLSAEGRFEEVVGFLDGSLIHD